MEDVILELSKAVQFINFKVLFIALGVGFLLLWVSLVIWVFADAKKRFTNKKIPIVYLVLTAISFVFGYLVYMILRPRYTLEEKVWADKEKEFLEGEFGILEKCPICGFDKIFSDMVYCPACKAQLRIRCEVCKAPLEKAWQYCPTCGANNKLFDPSLLNETEEKEKESEKEQEQVKIEEKITKVETKKSSGKSDKKAAATKSIFSRISKPFVQLFASVGNFFSNLGKKKSTKTKKEATSVEEKFNESYDKKEPKASAKKEVKKVRRKKRKRKLKKSKK